MSNRERSLTPAAEVEQHLQQVGVVDDAVPVEVFVAVAAPNKVSSIRRRYDRRGSSVKDNLEELE